MALVSVNREHRRARTRLLLIPTLFLLARSAETSSAQPADDTARQIIAHADEGAVAEVNRHDAHALSARYWDDAIDISPAGIVSGRPEIERRFAEIFKALDPQDFTESIDQAEFSGKQGWFFGHWSDTRRAADGSRHLVKGYVAAVLEKRGDEWKARLHVITVSP